MAVAKSRINSGVGIAANSTAEARKLATRRLEAYERLQKEKSALDTKFSVAFDDNQAQAAKIGRWKTGIGISGIASGIAASALIVASPANAVWVSVLSGYAGGVAGMNSVFDNNGYSREQIAALETTVVQEYAAVSAEINLEVLFALANDVATTSEKWLEELGKQNRAMTRLRALALTLKIPTGSSQTPPAPEANPSN
ncbi:MAG: hypothetical protein KIS67_28565 [Verrucomicrobiae bacterium]|nr:hypothetical protein [Verrucomicrobiae bacterium]